MKVSRDSLRMRKYSLVSSSCFPKGMVHGVFGESNDDSIKSLRHNFFRKREEETLSPRRQGRISKVDPSTTTIVGFTCYLGFYYYLDTLWIRFPDFLSFVKHQHRPAAK